MEASQPSQPVQPQSSQGVKTNTLAIVGFILSFVFAFAGLIISIIAYNQIKKSGEDGRGLALAGIIIGAVFSVLGLLYVFFLVAMFSGVMGPALASGTFGQ
ncbi:MAG: DUF4190 domain-containing protein [Nanoarchaeota archaeon]